MSRLWPNISDHDSLAVTAEWVTQEVCQFSLTVWNMTTLFAWKGKDNLLEETERLIDEARLFKDKAFRSSLLGHFTASEIDQVQLGEDNFVCGFDSWTRLYVQSENSVRTRRVLIQVVLADSPLHFTLEEAIKCVFLRVTDLLGQALDCHSTALVVCNLQVLLASYGASLFIGKQVSNLLIINLRVTDPNRDGLIKFIARERVNLGDGTRYKSSVFEDWGTSSHWISFASTCLSVAENGTVVALDDRLDDFTRTNFVSFILASIMKNLLKVELPDVSLIINHTECFVLVLLESDCARDGINLDVFTREVSCGSRSNHNFNSLFRWHTPSFFYSKLAACYLFVKLITNILSNINQTIYLKP